MKRKVEMYRAALGMIFLGRAEFIHNMSEKILTLREYKLSDEKKVLNGSSIGSSRAAK